MGLRSLRTYKIYSDGQVRYVRCRTVCSMTSWEPPTAKVLSVTPIGEGFELLIQLPSGLAAPLAPATLVLKDHAATHVDAVLFADSSGETVFRTEDATCCDLVGETVGFRSWWTPKQLAAVIDTSRDWILDTAPDPQNHGHCVLDWAAIEAGSVNVVAWRSQDDLMCSDCYQKYVLGDHLRVRGHP